MTASASATSTSIPDASAGGVVILGAPRSGTTLLRRLLDAHSRIACPPETYALSAAARFLHEESFGEGLRIGVLLGLSYAGFSEEEVLSRLRAFVFSFLQEHAAREGKARWAEKTAFNAFHLPEIRRLCGDGVRYVCIQRHGLDVVLSLEELVKKTGGYVQELHDYLRRYPEPYEAFARAWIDCAGAIQELVDSDERALGIRYEELVADPEGVLARILDHIGEPWEEGLVARALGEAKSVGFGDWKTYGRAAIDASSVERWRKLPRATLKRLADRCNPTLRRLGYDEVTVAPPESDADARRRYELGLLLGKMRADKERARAEAEAREKAQDTVQDTVQGTVQGTSPGEAETPNGAQNEDLP